MFEFLSAIAAPVAQAAGTVGATAIRADAAKSIARTEYKSSLQTLLAQERFLTAQAERDAETQRLANAMQASREQNLTLVAGLALLAFVAWKG